VPLSLGNGVRIAVDVAIPYVVDGASEPDSESDSTRDLVKVSSISSFRYRVIVKIIPSSSFLFLNRFRSRRTI
jgi:hypothetical protein